MLDFWIVLSVFFPVAAGVLAFLDKGNAHHKKLVTMTGGVLVVAALGLAANVPSTVFYKSSLASALKGPIVFFDFLLLAGIVYIGFRRKNSLIMALAALQFAGMLILKEVFQPIVHDTTPAFMIDSLAVTLVLVVSFVGSLIALYSLGYMKEHEHHLGLTQSKQPQFFALLLIFLGAMNGLALADDLTWLYFFWEVTTLCSFLLIAHDGTEIANTNATRALWMNMAGGAAFVFALLYLQQRTGTLSISELRYLQASEGFKPLVLMIPMVALCVAGFTKSAQMPFQSWLCGAMVAPTPVSALLHSSTMVKAGVYLVLRLAPLYAGTAVSSMVAMCGAITFITAAAFACGQSNGKKILAYSTISNLGLIVACAGINTSASIAAGMMLLIFHAVSKALLFLCVGSIEQKIGSRDIEDMRGLFKVMPRTALLTTFGIITMMLPPFGMLLAKWMALESAIAMPIIVVLLALGSGLTVLFWARWAGIMLGSAEPRLSVGAETIEPTIRQPLQILAGSAAGLSFFAPMVYVWLVLPAVQSSYMASPLVYTASVAGLANGYGVFAVYPIYLLIAGGFWYAWREAKKYSPVGHNLPYMGGMQAEQDGKTGFIGPMKGFVEVTASNYYLQSLFGEEKMTKPVNMLALALLGLLVGGALQ